MPPSFRGRAAFGLDVTQSGCGQSGRAGLKEFATARAGLLSDGGVGEIMSGILVG